MTRYGKGAQPYMEPSKRLYQGRIATTEETLEMIKKTRKEAAALAEKDDIPREQKEKKTTIKTEEHKAKLFVVAVRAGGDARVKIQKDKEPDIAPSEKVLFKIILETKREAPNSVIIKLRMFTEEIIASHYY